ncbi:hypothetical protein C8R45DRAFT_937337 [Mycena sanguinolenta]|nr:hypothetical protein C8R45DRAFT_937337 [Mycena sanguinolenta]
MSRGDVFEVWSIFRKTFGGQPDPPFPWEPALYGNYRQLLTANLWNREQAPPGGQSVKGKFPNGQFVFPFEFPELPTDTLVIQPNDAKRRNKARVPLPLTGFSGNIKYTVGVNIVFDGFGAIDDEFDMTFQYIPLCKPLPRVKTPFPYLPTREDWPFSREVVGGWTLTSFGGRGRLGEEMVEIEGITCIHFIIKLGVQEPAIYTAGQTIEFSLLLWSTNPLALEALGQPAAIQVGFYKPDIFALDAMTPRTSTRKNRYLEQLAAGHMWRTDDGRPADYEPSPDFRMGSTPKPSPASAGSHRLKGAPSSRMKEVWAEKYVAENSNPDAPQLKEKSEDPTFYDDGTLTTDTSI